MRATDWSHPRGVRPPGSFRSTSRQELALALQAAAQDESRMAAVRHVALSLGLGPVRDEVLREELLRRFDSRSLTAIWIPDAGIFDGPLSAIPSGLELYRPGMRGQGAALQPTRGINVAAMPMEDRCVEVLKRAAPLVPGDMRDEFLAIVQTESLLTGAAVAIAVILVSPLGTVGAIVAGLAVGVSAIFIGLEIFQAAGLLVEAFDLIRRAGSEADLDRAAETFAQVFSKVAVSFVMAYLTKAARGARKRRVEAASGSPVAPSGRVATSAKATPAPRNAPAERSGDAGGGGIAGRAERRAQEVAAARQRAFGIAGRGDFSTPPGKSVFYSGKGNRERALASVEQGGRPIDATPGGAALNEENLYGEFSPLRGEADKIWSRASTRYAESASGDVTAYVRGASPDRVFGSTELPVLLKNQQVTSINGIPRDRLASMPLGEAFDAVKGAAP